MEAARAARRGEPTSHAYQFPWLFSMNTRQAMHKGNTLVEILIPTYNRAGFLKKNIEGLASAIRNLDPVQIGLVVCDNCSTDGTLAVVTEKIEQNPDLSIRFFRQTTNVGLEENVVFALSNAIADFVIFTGDDDFLHPDYMRCVLKLAKEPRVTCVLPAIASLDVHGHKIPGGRDLALTSTTWGAGVSSAIRNIHRGCSIAGTAFRRDGTLEAYLHAGLRNIYPFMFFVGYNCLRGECRHVTDFPVLVTQPPQEKKAWDYGRDGLYDARFANCRAIFHRLGSRFRAEKRVLERTTFVLDMFLADHRRRWPFLLRFMSLKNATVLIKLYLPVFLLKRKLKAVFRYRQH